VRVHFPEPAFTVAGLYFPDGQAGIREFWPWVHHGARKRLDEAFLFIGDLNSGSTAFDAESDS
jgi:hypothetical protein